VTLLDEWVEKAEVDYLTAVLANRQRKQPLPDSVCYHAQQCAEKYLKAYLVFRGATPPRTHDLARLLNQCASYDATLAAKMSLVQSLDPYSVAFRYPGVSATIIQAKEAVKTMRRLRTFLRRKLGL
jgi:HEPN domain-containing protein